MHEKRGLWTPPEQDAKFITHDHVVAAIYFSSCINIEWLELDQAYSEYLSALGAFKPNAQELRQIALEELIDVLHFILSVFIFLGLREESVRMLNHLKIYTDSTLTEYAGDTMLAISALIAKAPYKNWKDQDNTKEIDKEWQHLLFCKLAICYNNVIDFALQNLSSSYQEIVDTYIRKNELNFKRQEDVSLGYVH